MTPIWSKILRLSLGTHGSPEIHNDLLVLYFDWLAAPDASGSGIMSALKRITGTYRPSPVFFPHVLARLTAAGDAQPKDIMRLHEAWRVVCLTDKQKIDEGMAVVQELLGRRMMKEAMGLVETVRVEVRGRAGALVELESRWEEVLRSQEDESGDSESEEEDEDENDHDGGREEELDEEMPL